MRPHRRCCAREKFVIGVAILLVVFFNIHLSSNVVYVDHDSKAQLPPPTTKDGTITQSPRYTPVVARQHLPILVPPKQIQRDAPFHLRQKTPIFVVGLPKVGTTSIHHMFQCNGVKSSHYCCCGSNRTHTHCNDGGRLFSECMRKNMKQKRPILQDCGTYDVYAQMDGELGKSLFLPQRFQLDLLHEHAPDATFILNTRSSEDWVRSVSSWFGLGGRFLTRFHIDHKVERRLQVLEDIYNNHSNFIREFVRQHPSHTLIEVNITSADAGRVMADAFGLDESCWAQHNKNRKKEN